MSLLCLLAAAPELRAGMAPPGDWLTPSETARWQAFGTDTRRDTFLAGRWLARCAARQWLGADALPPLGVADSGVCEVLDRDDVFVSISHSAGQVACAVAAAPVGVDVESLARPRDHLALAETVHSAEQFELLAGLPPEARALPFLQLWTLKEAWLKARGQGLDFALMRSLAFDDDPQGDAALAQVGEVVMAVVCDAVLPLRIDGVHAVWQRHRSRR